MSIEDYKMTKEYYFKTEDLLIWRPTGNIKIEVIQDFIKFLEEYVASNNSDFKRFIDLSLIESISVNYEELYGIAADRRDHANKKFENIVNLAFYVNNALSFGMARMYENLLDTLCLQFRDILFVKRS